VFIFVNFSFALFTPPLGDFQVVCGAAHGDGDVGCQDGVTKVTCGVVHGDGDADCQDDAAKLAAEAMGSDRNPS
jgi:hypothetical protein